jgi:hypothetical protein
MLLLLAAFGIQVKTWAVQTPLTAADRPCPRMDILDVRPYCLSFGESGCSEVKHPPRQFAFKKKFF